MKNDITVIESQYNETNNKYQHGHVDHLIEVNNKLEVDIKRLRKEKDQLNEQLTLLKEFSDSLWSRLKANQFL